MVNKLKMLLLLQCVSQVAIGRITNISTSGASCGDAVNKGNELTAYGTIFKFDAVSGKFIFADSHFQSTVGMSAPRAVRIGSFSLVNGNISLALPLANPAKALFGADDTVTSILVRTMDSDGTNAYFALGDGSADGVKAAGSGGAATRGLFKVTLGDGTETTLPTATNLNDFANPNGSIDRVLYVPAKGDRPALLVVGVFQTGQSTYFNQDNGCVRVLKADDRAVVGALKVASGGAVLKFTTKAGGNLLGLFKESAVNTSDADFIHSMHYDAVLDRIFIGIYGDNDTAATRCCPYLVCRFDTNNTDLLAERLHGFVTFPADGGQNNIISTSHSKGIAVPLIKTMNLKAGTNAVSYLISNIQAVDDVQASNLAKNLCIYATPLVSRLTTVVAPVVIPSESDIGKAALVTTPAGSATTTFALPAISNASTDVYKATESESGVDTTCHIPALVGGGPVPASISTPISFVDEAGDGENAYLANITCLEVVYNTVLVGVTADIPAYNSGNAANTGIGSSLADNHRIGVWASTAIVDENGVIQGWTPWTRVLGVHLPVYGMSFDMNNMRLWTIHKEPAGPYFSGCSVTDVGMGHSIDPIVANENLLNSYGATGPTTLLKLLKSNLGNITYLKSFAGHRTANLGNMSVLVAAGDNGIVLAKTADTNWSANGVLSSCPLRESGYIGASKDENYVFFNITGIKGKVKAVEYSRLTDNLGIKKGFFFVGTTEGLYVLRKTAGGTGLSSTGASLKDGGAINDVSTADWTFAEVTVDGISLTNVQDLAVVGTRAQNYLLVLCNKKLVRIQISNTFVGATKVDFLTTGATPPAVSLVPSFDDREIGFSLQTFGSVSSQVVNAAAAAGASDLSGCGIMLTSKGIYQLRGLFDTVAANIAKFKYERIFGTVFGDGTPNSVRSVEVVPVSQWALNGQFGTQSTTRTVANLYIVTGDIFSGKGSEVYSVALKGQLKAPFANGTLFSGLAGRIKETMESADAYAFSLDDAANQNAFLATDGALAKAKIMGSSEIGSRLLNYLKIDGLPLIGGSWDTNASAGASGIGEGAQATKVTEDPARFGMVGMSGGDGSIAMMLTGEAGSTVVAMN